jgi:hypothetical protein
MKITVAVPAIILCAVPLATSQEPSLAEAARKEREKRARAGQTKVMTEEDLKKAKSSVVIPPAPASPSEAPKEGAAATGAAAGAAKPEKTDEELRAERKAELQKKMDEQGRIVAAVRKAVADAQRELNDLGTYTFGPRRASLMKTIEDGNAEIVKAQQAMDGLEDEARRQGLSLTRPQ